MVFILCYVWGKDTNDNVLGQKKKAWPNLDWPNLLMFPWRTACF